MNPTRRALIPLALGGFVPVVRLLASKPEVSDDAITDMVRRKLASDPDVKGGSLQVDVKNGVVTLSGNVPVEHARSKAEKLARKVRGVKSVVNQIKVAR